MSNYDTEDQQSWILLPPGDIAICRFPVSEIPERARLATACELNTANLARPFPWGYSNTPERAGPLWQNHRIGIGGLYHDKWFITEQGRFGGARNVPTQLPGSLRSSFNYDGGLAAENHVLAENEGYAIVRNVSEVNRDMYRRIQMHANEHVAADGGHIIVSPLDEVRRAAYVGFVGRCQTCPNPELISFRQLQQAVPGYNFELFDEWKGWSLATRPNALPARDQPV
ncbi:MAG: hypothetical protein GC137_04460 [Alphaproteobacteria bacterium]|nr:hypothetical protein [Alphaproteobacteria bacterium]